MTKKTEIKIWHLIVFIFFFNFMGKFIGLYSGVSLAAKYFIEAISSIIFIYFLFFIINDLKKFVFGIPLTKWSSGIVLGLVVGVILWYTVVLYKPLVVLILDSCNSDICNYLWQNYYAYNNTIQYSKISWILVAAMLAEFVIIGPVREELLYRSAMITILVKRYSLVVSSLIIAFIFSIFHLKNIIPTFAISLTMSALVLKYKNIIAAAVAHGSYNFLIYFIFPPITVIGSYKNLNYFDIMLFFILFINICYWSIYVIKKSSLDWLQDA